MRRYVSKKERLVPERKKSHDSMTKKSLFSLHMKTKIVVTETATHTFDSQLLSKHLNIMLS